MTFLEINGHSNHQNKNYWWKVSEISTKIKEYWQQVTQIGIEFV